jgi:hypothetical protein
MPSLVKTLPRWYSTVRALMNRRVPISGLVSPSRASLAIWSSCAVSLPGSAARSSWPCYQTAKCLGNNPRTLADETQAALRRALTLGTGTAQTQPEPPGSG